MSNLPTTAITHIFNGDITADDKVSAAQLDTQLGNIAANQNAQKAVIDRITGSDNNLATASVGIAQLKAEVLGAIQVTDGAVAIAPAMVPFVQSGSTAAARATLSIVDPSAAMTPVIQAATLAAGRNALGISTVMDPVVTAATLALARTAMDPNSGDWNTKATGSTTARSNADRAADYINALDWAPDRTGVTDATTALQAAINAATAGQTVWIPRGTYLTTGLTISKQIRLVGDGAGTILRASGATAQVIAVSAGEGAVISDLRLEGTKTDESVGDQFGIRVTAGNRGIIERCWFVGSTGVNGFNIQIQLQNVSYWHVRSCRFEQVIGTNSSFGYGCLVETCTGCSITDCVGIQSATQGRHHVYLSAGTSSSTVKGNRFFGGTQEMISIYALEAQGWCENNTVEGNLCTGSVLALNLGGVIGILQKCRWNAIRGNTIRSNLLGNGILVQAGTGAADSRAPYNVIEGNIVAENGRNGIKLAGCDDCLVHGNWIYDNSQSSNTTYSGIEISPNGANAPCNRNRIIGNQASGTAQQRNPWRVADASGVRPLDTVLRGNESPKGGFGYAQDSGDRTVVDESYTIKKRMTYADFAAAATSNIVTMFTLGPGERVEAVTIKHETAFTGGAIATYTLSVGITGTGAKYAAAFNVFQAPGAAVFQHSTTQGYENMATGETAIRATVACTGANLNAATAGEANIWVTVRRVAMPVQ